MRRKYAPASEPQHNSVKLLFSSTHIVSRCLLWLMDHKQQPRCPNCGVWTTSLTPDVCSYQHTLYFNAWFWRMDHTPQPRTRWGSKQGEFPAVYGSPIRVLYVLYSLDSGINPETPQGQPIAVHTSWRHEIVGSKYPNTLI